MRAIVVSESGGPEVLVPGERPDPVPGPGEALVDVAASGVNFIDVYYRTGAYAQPLPYVPGVEGAGTVAAVGEGVGDVAVGDRVAWSNVQGSYAQKAVVPVDKVVPVPDGQVGGVVHALAERIENRLGDRRQAGGFSRLEGEADQLGSQPVALARVVGQEAALHQRRGQAMDGAAAEAQPALQLGQDDRPAASGVEDVERAGQGLAGAVGRSGPNARGGVDVSGHATHREVYPACRPS